jgi:ATP-dependent 26S proteasome regulatory subunit
VFVVDKATRIECVYVTADKPSTTTRNVNTSLPQESVSIVSTATVVREERASDECRFVGLDDVRETLRDVVVQRLQHATAFAAMGVDAPRGALLYGPPGVGKRSDVRCSVFTRLA